MTQTDFSALFSTVAAWYKDLCGDRLPLLSRTTVLADIALEMEGHPGVTWIPTQMGWFSIMVAADQDLRALRRPRVR